MSDLSDPVQRAVMRLIEQEHLIRRGDTVVVGVSGGPDSLCLLHVLRACRSRLGIELCAAHLNHLLRGADADADARFVQDLAADWEIPCVVERRDVRAAAQQRRLALEEAARRERYEFLRQVARNVQATRIAVGHHADDQSETVLMHWLRGAGLGGLRGMLPATSLSDLRLWEDRPLPDSPVLIRPLLYTPRTDIEQYCRRHGLSPRFDRSNLDTTFFRNRLRHELLPYLEAEFRPHFRQILCRSAQVIRQDYDLLCMLGDQAWQSVVRQSGEHAVMLDKAAWQLLHPALQRATLRRAMQQLRWSLRDVHFEHIEAAIRVARHGQVGDQAMLPRRVMLTVGYATIWIADEDFAPPPDFPAMSVDCLALNVPGQTQLPDGGRVEVCLLDVGDMPAGWAQNDDPWRAWLDADAVGPVLSLRRRRPGDRFYPLGLGGHTKQVSDLLINARTPAWWRDRVPLLARQDDEIMWVCGWRVDERAKITAQTRRVVEIALTRAEKTGE